jgi:hypothetical protein
MQEPESPHIKRARQGAANAALTVEQKRRLAIAARRAWMLHGDARLRAETEPFDAWRHRHTLMCVERDGLCASTNEDYLPLMAHFSAQSANALQRLGATGASARLASRADAMRQRAVTEPRSWAWARLERECREAQDVIAKPMAYLSSIANCKFRTGDLKGLTDKQLWCLIFDLRRNAAARRRRHAAGRPA